MVLELSEHDLKEIRDFQDLFADARFDIADDHISVEINIDDAEAKISGEKQDIYGCILQMYYDKIDVESIGVEQRTKISDMLNATKEIFESFCGKGVSFDSRTIDKLLMYFEA